VAVAATGTTTRAITTATGYIRVRVSGTLTGALTRSTQTQVSESRKLSGVNPRFALIRYLQILTSHLQCIGE
jgi:hypothetical protein